jgi:hypothetical protein
MKDLALRRETLVAQAAVQRMRAADAVTSIRRGIGSVERSVGILRYLAHKPLVIGLGMAAIALLIAKPRPTAKWLGYALTVYTMFRRARRALYPQATD